MPPKAITRSRVTTLMLVPALLASALTLTRPPTPAEATSGSSPYQMPSVTDVNADPGIVETTLVADEATVDIGGGVMANALTFNGAIPGPAFNLTVGQRVIVHFENHLDSEATGIHWHGIELANNNDGTPLTQNQVAAGDSFLYDFVVTRPGVFWYHPHHEFSSNQVFKGMSGALIVADPNEAPLIASGALPGSLQTVPLILNDITVCKAPGFNDAETYDLTLPWAGGDPLPPQAGPKPVDLCESPIDNHGMPLGGPLQAGDVPNVQKHSGRTNEGQTVLTNGVNVGGRAGDPSAPGALASGAATMQVQPGQGLRLQLLNTAATRFFRLRLTTDDGTQVPLVRVGGEGGLLDAAVIEGGVPGGFDFKYDQGEILLDAADRTDVVAAIPATATGVLTLWTEDFQRTGSGDGHGGWPRTPTVPVAHFQVTGSAVSPAYTIADGTPLRSATGDTVDVVPAPTATLLDPTTFATPKDGLASQNIQFTSDGAHPSIDHIVATHDYIIDYALQDKIGSARYATLGDTLELTVENTTPAHHPYHLHGFSIQPISYACPATSTSFTFPRTEFVDTVDVPPGCTLTYRIQLHDRPMMDGVTPGGGLGRWMIHCHIFFHHHQGMASELVIADPNGNERPYVDAIDPVVTAPEGGTATLGGTISDPDGDAVTLTASLGSVVDNGDGTWSWSHPVADGPAQQFVYVTATDSQGNTGQAGFILASENVPPSVSIDPAQVITIDEGQTLSVAATFTDPGDDDPYTATIDYGDGAGPQPASAALTSTTPPQSGTVAGSFTYGDDGAYPVTVAVTDKDGGTGTASFVVTVGNVSPDAIIETAGPILVDVAVPVALDGRATDPGSDDLTTTWSFDDGTADDVAISLVNPPSADPPMSPSVQPRDVQHDVSHAFAEACPYLVSFTAADDDGGTDQATILVLVTGSPTESRNAGYWQKSYGHKGTAFFSDAQLACYLELVGILSSVFDEARSAATIDEAYDDVFVAGHHGSMLEQLDRQLLTAWLNFANGGVEPDELLDTDGDGVAETTFASMMSTAESVRLNPSSTRAELEVQRDILERVNGRDGV